MARMGVRRAVGEKGLLLEEDLLREAHLGQNVQVVVQRGEIRLLPVEEREDWRKALDDLAGCLGTECIEDYDFDLKIRNPYEA
jgi:prevent-host-death family protein